MDKIKEEFGKWQGEQTTPENIDFAKGCFPNESGMDRIFIAMGFYAGYKSRDEEIKKLRDLLIELGNILYVDSDGMGNIQTAGNLIEEALKESE